MEPEIPRCFFKQWPGMELVFATHNPHKLKEIRQVLGDEIHLISLDELGCKDEIPEPYETLEENARSKTRFIRRHYDRDCFADDTGLEIEALHGEPGVHSARYAWGEDHSGSLEERSIANIEKVLHNMKGMKNRKACFRTVISLDMDGKHLFFEGKVPGTILSNSSGKEGFGYDPIFLPEGYSKTFAEMSLEEKSRISHRAIAFMKLRNFLQRHSKEGAR
jgi:XTP/dITP diphosphohydrolase